MLNMRPATGVARCTRHRRTGPTADRAARVLKVITAAKAHAGDREPAEMSENSDRRLIKTAISDIQYQLDQERSKTLQLEKYIKAIQKELDDLRANRRDEPTKKDDASLVKSNEYLYPSNGLKIETSVTPSSTNAVAQHFSNEKLKTVRTNPGSSHKTEQDRASSQNPVSPELFEDTFLKMKSLFDTMSSTNFKLIEEYKHLKEKVSHESKAYGPRESNAESAVLMKPLVKCLYIVHEEAQGEG